MSKSKNTKEKIILSALKLFNANGIANVRLQHIADEAFVSVGNLAYHYPNKEAIVHKIYDEMASKQKELMIEYRTVPLFENIDRLIKATFFLQQEYLFFYLDTLEITRLYPEIGQKHQAHLQAQILQLQTIIHFNAARGAFVPETEPGIYAQLAIQLWTILDLWVVQSTLRKQAIDKLESYQESVWAILKPFFTDMGKREFTQMRRMPYQFP